MEIRRSLCYIIIKCIVIQYVDSKSISLNDIIAAESQKTVTAKPLPPKATGSEAKPILSDEIISTDSQENQVAENTLAQKLSVLPKPFTLLRRLALKAKLNKLKRGNKLKIPPLRNRKKFNIKSPLKPKKLKVNLKPRHKQKNQAIKREISGNENLNQKYIPLLKSLSMLFDNLLDDDRSESSELQEHNRGQFHSEELFEIPCNCSSSSGIPKLRPQKKTTTPSPPFSAQISSGTEGLAIDENYDDSTLRPYKSIPLLLPRNTFGARRDDNGPSQRSGATHYRDFKRNLAGDYGDYEYNTRRCGENDSCTEGYENDTDSNTRNDASSNGHSRTSRKRNNTSNPKNRKTFTYTTIKSKNENTDDPFGKNKFEIRRNKTQSEKSVREPIRRLREFVSEDKISRDERILPNIVQPEVPKESIINATDNSAGDKRFTHKSSPFAIEDEKIRSRNETVIHIERDSTGNFSKSTGKKPPVVLIFDGYSVTRDKNGESKVSGKTIHILR